MAHVRSISSALARMTRAAQIREQKVFVRKHIVRFSLEDRERSETVLTPLAFNLTEQALKTKFAGQPIYTCVMARYEQGEILRDSLHRGSLEREQFSRR